MQEGRAPRWRDLVLAMETARPPSFTATYACRDSPTDEQTTGRLWFRPPGSLRVERADGSVRHVRDEEYFYFVRPDGVARRAPRGRTWACVDGVDQLVFPGQVGWTDRGGGYEPPTGEPREVTVAGRRGWQVKLPPNRPDKSPLTVVVDDDWGIVLRLAGPWKGAVYELRDVTEQRELPDRLFAWDGPLDTSEDEFVARRQRLQRWAATTPPPVPRYWPRGALADLRDGDPATGAVTCVLELPGWPVLDRRPHDATPYVAQQPHRHVHRWADERWQWALDVDEPLPDEELWRVVASIPSS